MWVPVGPRGGFFALRVHHAPGSVPGLCVLVGVIAILTLQTRTLRNRDVNKLAQGHTANRQRSWTQTQTGRTAKSTFPVAHDLNAGLR